MPVIESAFHVQACRLAAAAALAAIVVGAIGCGGTSAPTATTPFLSADRVPPPTTRVVAPNGTATPYYGAPATTPAAPPAASAWPPASGGYPAPPATAPPGSATPVYDTPPYPPAGQPAGAPPAGPYSASPQLGATSPTRGDAVSIPGDAGALRFASPSEVALARTPANEPMTQLAQTPATASGWIANSGPVRGSTSVAATLGPPRPNLPTSDQAPVSLARLAPTGGVPMAPLEPAPAAGVNQPGGRAPLRVALPSSSTYR